MHARQQQCACLQLKPYTRDHVQRAKIDPSHFTVAGSILAGIAFWAWLGLVFLLPFSCSRPRA